MKARKLTEVKRKLPRGRVFRIQRRVAARAAEYITQMGDGRRLRSDLHLSGVEAALVVEILSEKMRRLGKEPKPDYRRIIELARTARLFNQALLDCGTALLAHD